MVQKTAMPYALANGQNFPEQQRAFAGMAMRERAAH
jgi:hypothetical protein